MPAADIAHVLGGRRCGNGYVVRCPAHQDRHPSLSLCDGERGLLVKCHAGCDARDVLAELRRRGDHDRRQRDKAERLWSQRQPIVGTAAERYLCARGYDAPTPPTIAFLPAAADIQAMAEASGLVDTYGDDIVSATGFAEAELEAKQSTTVPSAGISNEELDAKAVANDVARPVGQQLIIRRASEIAPEPITRPNRHILARAVQRLASTGLICWRDFHRLEWDPIMPVDSDFIPGPKLRAKLGISAVTLWRWRHDPRAGFPAPKLINGRLYFPSDARAKSGAG